MLRCKCIVLKTLAAAHTYQRLLVLLYYNLLLSVIDYSLRTLIFSVTAWQEKHDYCHVLIFTSDSREGENRNRSATTDEQTFWQNDVIICTSGSVLCDKRSGWWFSATYQRLIIAKNNGTKILTIRVETVIVGIHLVFETPCKRNKNTTMSNFEAVLQKVHHRWLGYEWARCIISSRPWLSRPTALYTQMNNRQLWHFIYLGFS